MPPMTSATQRRLARLVVTGLGATRLVEGVVESAAPGAFITRIGATDPGPGTLMGFRMKGGRDAGLGVMTLLSVGDDRALARLAVGAIVVDAVDGLAVVMDRGRTFGPPVQPMGAVLGFVTAGVAAWAARTLSS